MKNRSGRCIPSTECTSVYPRQPCSRLTPAPLTVLHTHALRTCIFYSSSETSTMASFLARASRRCARQTFALAQYGGDFSGVGTVGVRQQFFSSGNLSEGNNRSEWPPYTLDKYGQVKGKRLTKQAGHMLELLDREAVAAKVDQGSVTNDSFKVGDAVEVKFLMNLSKERQHTFTGIVIGKRNRGINSSFTVRNVVDGVAVERSFPTFMPLLKEVNIIKEAYIHKRDGKKVRRAKLNYLRDRPLGQSTVTIKLTKQQKEAKLKARFKMKAARKKSKK